MRRDMHFARHDNQQSGRDRACAREKFALAESARLTEAAQPLDHRFAERRKGLLAARIQGGWRGFGHRSLPAAPGARRLRMLTYNYDVSARQQRRFPADEPPHLG